MGALEAAGGRAKSGKALASEPLDLPVHVPCERMGISVLEGVGAHVCEALWACVSVSVNAEKAGAVFVSRTAEFPAPGTW